MSKENGKLIKIQKRFLAYLLNNRRFIASSMGKIRPMHLPDYGWLYSLLITYYNKHRDVITDEIVDIMFSKKNMDANTIVKYKSIIGELRDTKINNDAEFNSLIEELEEAQKRKDYISVAEMIIENDPINSSTEKLEEMEKNVKEQLTKITASKGEVRKEGLIKDSANERWKSYVKVKTEPESIRFIPTGFKKIDDENGGFRPGELIYVIGRKGDGKSVLLLNLAHNMWKAGCNVVIFTLEISKEDYERRFDSRAAGVSSNRLKMGKLEELEEGIYKKYIENNAKGLGPEGEQVGNVFIVDCPQGCTPAFVESKLDTIEQLYDFKADVVITDYAGIMKPNVSIAEKRHEQGQIALDQKRIAREREVVVISAAQMSREGGKSKEADTSHVAESDQVSDHIDWGIAIRSLSDTTGKMESFKTRDAAPFLFHFTKKYSQMKIMELEDNLSSWDDLSSLE